MIVWGHMTHLPCHMANGNDDSARKLNRNLNVPFMSCLAIITSMALHGTPQLTQEHLAIFLGKYYLSTAILHIFQN